MPNSQPIRLGPTMQLLAHVCANPLYDGRSIETVNQEINRLQEKSDQLKTDISKLP